MYVWVTAAEGRAVSIRDSCVHVLATRESGDLESATVYVYTYMISTGVFILINQERNKIRPFVFE